MKICKHFFAIGTNFNYYAPIWPCEMKGWTGHPFFLQGGAEQEQNLQGNAGLGRGNTAHSAGYGLKSICQEQFFKHCQRHNGPEG